MNIFWINTDYSRYWEMAFKTTLLLGWRSTAALLQANRPVQPGRFTWILITTRFKTEVCILQIVGSQLFQWVSIQPIILCTWNALSLTTSASCSYYTFTTGNSLAPVRTCVINTRNVGILNNLLSCPSHKTVPLPDTILCPHRDGDGVPWGGGGHTMTN